MVMTPSSGPFPLLVQRFVTKAGFAFTFVFVWFGICIILHLCKFDRNECARTRSKHRNAMDSGCFDSYRISERNISVGSVVVAELNLDSRLRLMLYTRLASPRAVCIDNPRPQDNPQDVKSQGGDETGNILL